MSLINDILARRSMIRAKYLPHSPSVPELKLLLHPKKWRELHSDPEIMSYRSIDRNPPQFAGMTIIETPYVDGWEIVSREEM